MRPEQLIEIHHMRQLRTLIAENETFLFEMRSPLVWPEGTPDSAVEGVTGEPQDSVVAA